MTPSESLNIAEIIIYPPILLALIFVLVRHGGSRQSGFIYLATFCIIRTVGAGFGIAGALNPRNVTDLIWSAILGSIGIFAMLGASLGLLKRIIDQTSTRAPRPLGERNPVEAVLSYLPVIGLIAKVVTRRTTAVSRRSRFIQIVQLPASAALVLCIVGGIDSTSSEISTQKEGKSLLKAGIIIFLVIYLCLVALAAKSATEFNRIPAGEKRILVVVLAALPLLAVRFLWTLLAYFSDFSTFSTIHGSVTVRAFMATLEEFLIVIAYTIVGLMIPKYTYAPAYDSEATRIKQQDALGGTHMQELSPVYQPSNARK